MKYEFKGTPGPWRWEVNERSKNIDICGGKPMFDLTVMGFERWGMGGAAPQFRSFGGDFDVLKRAENFSVIVKGREHHSNWFKTIDHPDANLISASPDLLQAAIELLENVESNNDNNLNLYHKFKQAVHKALNIK